MVPKQDEDDCYDGLVPLTSKSTFNRTLGVTRLLRLESKQILSILFLEPPAHEDSVMFCLVNMISAKVYALLIPRLFPSPHTESKLCFILARNSDFSFQISVILLYI